MIGTLKNIGVGDHKKHARWRTFDEAAGGFEDGDARAFGADQCAGDVKAVFGEQIVEVVSGDATRNVGEASADEFGVLGRDLL